MLVEFEQRIRMTAHRPEGREGEALEARRGRVEVTLEIEGISHWRRPRSNAGA